MDHLAPLLDRLVPLVLANVTREYPNGSPHRPNDERDLAPPRERHPSFFGCYDWHSAVHSHWLLARSLKLAPKASWADEAWSALARALDGRSLAQELAYLEAHPSFEVPYGLAWLLELSRELEGWIGSAVAEDQVAAWAAALQPLVTLAAERLQRHATRLPRAVRGGLHNQTAFALGLLHDWAEARGDAEVQTFVREQAERLHGADVAAPFAYEPSGTDFLSPALAAADLLRRTRSADAFLVWVVRFVAPHDLGRLDAVLSPVGVVDPSDGQLAHYAGLNLSRAWMLDGIAGALDRAESGRAFVAPLRALAAAHRSAGLALADHPDFMMSHWVPTFALRAADAAPAPVTADHGMVPGTVP